MNIPGKLRDDLKRIYGAIDPLNCIEDIRVEDSSLGTEVKLTLRVPNSCLKYAQSIPAYRAPHSMGQWAMEQAMMAGPLSSPLPSVELSASEIADIRKLIEEGCRPHTFLGYNNKCEGSKKKDAPDFEKPSRVVFSGPKTILFWPDGSKTMVSLGEGEEHDEYTAFCTAIVKKLFGATHKAKKFLNSAKVIQKPKTKKSKVDEEQMTIPESV